MEQMREAVRQAPDCFIARLKFGELLMRLRICDQAAEQTQKAARTRMQRRAVRPGAQAGRHHSHHAAGKASSAEAIGVCSPD